MLSLNSLEGLKIAEKKGSHENSFLYCLHKWYAKIHPGKWKYSPALTNQGKKTKKEMISSHLQTELVVYRTMVQDSPKKSNVFLIMMHVYICIYTYIILHIYTIYDIYDMIYVKYFIYT